MVLLNAAFDEWAARFDALRAATDCPTISAIDVLCPIEETAYTDFVAWLTKHGLMKQGGALLMHCHRGRTLRRNLRRGTTCKT